MRDRPTGPYKKEIKLNDTKRAALIALIQSVFPVLNILLGAFGQTQLTTDQISIIMLLVTNGLTTLFLFWKSGQAAS